MYNELIIGLGGCGGRSIQAFRRTIELRSDDYADIQAKGTRFDYLYIDSNTDVLTNDGWTVFGKSIKLEESQIVDLKKNNPMSDIDVVSNYHNIKPWIGDITDSYNKHTSGVSGAAARKTLQTMTGAGQLRRYGRVLFALNAQEVRTALIRKITDLIHGREQKVMFRIFCTLGGGTGSGSLIDTVTLIRELCDDYQIEAKVLVYAYVAAAGAGISNAGSFYENEYCSLRDLNALIVGAYNPLVTCKQFSDHNDAVYKSTDSVTRVFVSSEVSPGSPKLGEQIENVTAACFDSIVYAHNHAQGDDDCLKAISDEDLVTSHPGEPRGHVVRSYRFGTLGARRWRVPTTQIRELLNRDIEVRVWDALLDGSKLPEGINREIDNLEGFCCEFTRSKTSEVYQVLESEITAPIEEIYKTMLAQKRRDVQVLSDLHTAAKKQLEQIKKLPTDQKKKVAFIDSYKVTVAAIEKEFIAQADDAIRWTAKVDVWGLKNVRAYLDKLRTTLNHWPDVCLSDEDMLSTKVAIEGKMEKREAEWTKLGFLTIQLTKLDERMMEAQYQDAKSLVLNALESYKRSVVKDLVVKVDEMCRRVSASLDSFIGRAEKAKSDAAAQANKIFGELQKHTNNSANEKSDLYEYDASNLKAVRDAMLEQYDLLKGDMANYSDALKTAVGGGNSLIQCGQTSFDAFKLDMDSSLLDKTTTKIHDEACRAIAKPSVLVGDIIERLEQIGGAVPSNWEMRLGELVRSFMTNIPVCASIEGKDGLHDPQTSPCAAIVIGLPASTKTQLVDWLKKKLKASQPNNFFVMRSEFYTHQTKEEIRVLYVPYWMPCRFLKVTKYVEEKYYKTVNKASESKFGTMYFSNYDASGEDLSAKFNRPALTKSSEPDKDNEILTEAAKLLFVKVKGASRPIVKISDSDRTISFACKIDDLEGVKYGTSHAQTRIQFPNASYKEDMNVAIKLAVDPTPEAWLYESMTVEEKKEKVYKKYHSVVEELENKQEQNSPEYEPAVHKRALVRQMLKL